MKWPEINTTEELIELIKVVGWLIAVIVVMVVFGGTVFAMLYSIIFVTQPIKSMAPIDMAFSKMLNDVVLLLVGSITTLIGMYAVTKGAKSIAERVIPPSPTQPQCGQNNGSYGGYSSNYPPQPSTAYGGLPSQAFGAMPVWTNPELDETWTPPPPPTTPPDHLEPDQEREQLALARNEAD